MTVLDQLTYTERLHTFKHSWGEDKFQTTARQLAAIGHVADVPPLEALEEGSRCVSCSVFVKRELSTTALGDVASVRIKSYSQAFDSFNFHHPSCKRLQVRIPLDPQALLPGLYGFHLHDLRDRFERKPNVAQAPSVPAQRLSQSSSLFSLPIEIRLEIYKMILPSLDQETEIVPLNRESARVITKQGYQKTGPRDTTKPNILRTCRAVNEEAMDSIYSHTTFTFNSTKIMYLFLRSIGKSGRNLIKAVDVTCGGREDAIAFSMLASCEMLKAIIIRLPRPMMLYSSSPPLWLVDGISCMLALRGLERVSFGPCGSMVNCLSDEKPDAAVIRRELLRPRGTPGDDHIMKTYLEL